MLWHSFLDYLAPKLFVFEFPLETLDHLNEFPPSWYGVFHAKELVMT